MVPNRNVRVTYKALGGVQDAVKWARVGVLVKYKFVREYKFPVNIFFLSTP